MALGPLRGPSRASLAPTWGAVLLFDGEELGDQLQSLLALGFVQLVERVLVRDLVQAEMVVERLTQPLLVEAAQMPEAQEFLVGCLFDLHHFGFIPRIVFRQSSVSSSRCGASSFAPSKSRAWAAASRSGCHSS